MFAARRGSGHRHQGRQFMAEPSAVPSDFLGAIKKHARLALIIGILMVICGVLAIASPLAAGVYVTILVGLMLAFGGIAQCFLAFRAGAFGKGLMIFIVGALTAVAGFFLFNQPLEGLVSITLLLAAYFVVTGIFELISAFQMRPAGGWGLMLFNGVVTLLLGIMIWSQFPLSGVWAVGILFGVKLIMSGWALISIGRSVRGATDASA
jgi:uncharacterized membrane protein HdeD (DUF308 family)